MIKWAKVAVYRYLFNKYVGPLMFELLSLAGLNVSDVRLSGKNKTITVSRWPFNPNDTKTTVLHFVDLEIEDIFQNPIRSVSAIKHCCLDMKLSSSRQMPSATALRMQDYCVRRNREALSQQQLDEIVTYVMMIARGQIKIQPKESK